MNIWMRNSVAAVVLVVACGTSAADAPAQSLTLKVGDPAPRYALTTWLKGTPVPRLLPGHIYLLEFWATRCAPCIAALPHLKELSEQYAGKVTFIAIGEPYEWETVESVTQFVRKKDKLMPYPVALDALKGEKLYDRWGPPAGFAGLPVTFIVDKAGRVAWTGMPTGVEEPLKQIVAGTYDLAAARKQQQTDQDSALSESEQREAFQGMMSRKDWPGIIKRVDDLVARRPDQEGKVFPFKLEALSQTSVADAVAYARGLPQEYQGTAAELLADKPGLPKDAYVFMAEQLEKTVAADSDAHPVTWQTLAKVQHQLGNLDRAIEAQKTALAKSDAMGYKEISEQLRSELVAYQAEKAKKRGG